MDNRVFKKSSEELQEYMEFKRRGYYVKSKKGKGSYDRKSQNRELRKKKHTDYLEEAWE